MFADNVVRSLDLYISQHTSFNLEQGSRRDADDACLVGYIKLPDIEMANKHATVSPMFVISYLFLFFVKFSVISYFFSLFFYFFLFLIS